MNTAPRTINEHVFIRRSFFTGVFSKKSAQASQRKPVRVEQNSMRRNSC
jgi:hypothetical protein